MSDQTESKPSLKQAAQTYLDHLKAAHERGTLSDGEAQRDDRAAEIAYMEAHVDALDA